MKYFGNVVNYRSLNKVIREAEQGDTFYINTIGFSVKAIETLRAAIKSGTVKPVVDDLNEVINPEYVNEFMDGTRIYPQMRYEKQ